MNHTNERTTLLLVNIFILSLISTLIWAAIHRGPWIDEIFSLLASDSNIPFGVAFKNRWLEDVHPLFFVTLFYGLSNIITLDVPTGRLFNIVPMALSGVFFAYLYATDKDKGNRRFLVVFLITIASSYWFIQYFVEFRSYFSGLCAFSVLIVTIRYLCINSDIDKGVTRRIIWVAFSASLLICLNIHYITWLISAITVATFGVCFLVNGSGIYFIRFALLGILMSIPLILFAFLQSSSLQEFSSWVTTTPVQGAIMILLVMISVIAPQVVFCLLLPRLILRDSIKIHIFSQEDIVGLNFKYILAIVIFISSIVLLIINIKLKFIVFRYLIPLAVASIAILADITKDEIFSKPLFLNAFSN